MFTINTISTALLSPVPGFAQKGNSQVSELPAWIRRGGRAEGADGALD